MPVNLFQTDLTKITAAGIRAVLARIEAGEYGPCIETDLLAAIDAPLTLYSPLTSLDDATRLAGRLQQDSGPLLAVAVRTSPVGSPISYLARVVTATALRVHLAKLERKLS